MQQRQRWFCNQCRKSFFWRNAGSRKNNQRVWFERWITQGYSVRQLQSQSGLGRKTLLKIIRDFLDAVPPQNDVALRRCKHLIMDATFFKRELSILALLDAQTRKIVRGCYGVRENSPAQMHAALSELQRKGLEPRSITVDGNLATLRVIAKIWPRAKVQRCIVHVQRQGLMWCRIQPKRTDAKRLRRIFLQLCAVSSESQRKIFLREVAAWWNLHAAEIENSPERGWVFSDLKRATSLLSKSLPNLFHYLRDANIPRSTNALESYFSRLKDRYRKHRGLASKRKQNYFHWYFHLCPK